MTRQDNMHDMYLRLLSATGVLLSLIPVTIVPNLLTGAAAVLGIAVGALTLWLRLRQHRTQSRIEQMIEEDREKERQIAELQQRLARYEGE